MNSKRTIILASALSERLKGSYCVRCRGGFMAQAHEGLDWNQPAPEVIEQSG